MTIRARALAVLAATTAVATGCTADTSGQASATSSSDPVPVKVAFFQDGSIESPNTHTQPAFLGLKLAFSQAIEGGGLPVLPELVGLDTQGSAEVAAELAAEVAGDPAYVAAVAAPFWQDPVEVAPVLDAAGIPVLSLTGAPATSENGWVRMVAGDRQRVAALAGYVRGRRGAAGVCLAGDGSPYARGIADRLELVLRGSIFASVTVAPSSGDAAVAAGTVADAGCSTVIWTGFGTGAGELRSALAPVDHRELLFVGVDAMKDRAYLDLAADAAEDTVVACACVDLSTSTELASQRFVHDFQAAYSTPPGVYAAEGFDAGGILLRAFEEGLSTPEEVGASIREAPFEGLAGIHALGSEGPAPSVHLSRVERDRWLPIGADRQSLPLRTEGLLAVGSCRSGAPFAYRDPGGRLVGFDVELARAIASRADLALGWMRTSCGAGTAPVEEGRVDVLMTPVARLVPGTPSSRVFFSTRAALVAAAEPGRRPRLGDPGPDDVLGLATGGPIARWARRTSGGPGGAELRVFANSDRAYDLLERGALWAVADSEADAWAAIEHRPGLLVGSTDDIGAHDVMVASATSTELLTVVDDALAGLLADGSYALLFGKYFPGATLPGAVGA